VRRPTLNATQLHTEPRRPTYSEGVALYDAPSHVPLPTASAKVRPLGYAAVGFSCVPVRSGTRCIIRMIRNPKLWKTGYHLIGSRVGTATGACKL
jgi:hypothetical protein